MIDLTVDMDAPRFGPSFAKPKGGFVARGAGPYSHRFGGTSWRVIDPRELSGGPTLLFAFDLHDPVFSSLKLNAVTELPICTYTARDVWARPQLYEIHPDTKQLILTERDDPATDAHFPELLGPFPEITIHVEPLKAEDYPTNKDFYWRACDEFLGWSTKIIRIMGPPLWVYAAMAVRCTCRRRMKYVCALGYEGEKNRLGLIANELLFLGEAALYWFVCPNCLKLAVIPQDT